MEFLCIFIPAMIFCLVRRKLLKIGNEENSRVINLILEYAIACVAINFFFQLFIVSVYTKVTDISKYLNHDITFSLKYLLSASIIAIIIPCIEKYIRNNFEIEISYPQFRFDFQEFFLKIATFFNRIEEFLSKPKIQKMFYVFVVLIVLLVCGINIMRIYDNALWLDEMVTVLVTESDSINTVLDVAVRYGHSPLYYIFSWFCNIIIEFSKDYHYFYLYHITALLPWLVTILLGITFVKKWFGNVASLIFLACASLLHSSIYIALEVRMYSLCQLFILMTFLATYKCYQYPKTLNFIFLSVFAIFAIYSHYFALPVIAIIYLVMLVYFYLYDRENVKKIFISSNFIMVALLPWIIFNYQTKKEFISNYGLKGIAGIDSCINYIFSSEFSWFLFIIFLVAALKVFNRYLNLIKIYSSNGKRKIKIICNYNNFSNYKVAWMFSGLLSVLGTMILAVAFSHLFFPIITNWTLRYFLPAIVILWLLLGIFISKLQYKNIINIIVIVLIVVSGIPKIINTYNTEMKVNALHINTMDVIMNKINSQSFIITNQKHITYSAIREGYFNLNANHIKFLDLKKLPVFKTNEKYFLILQKPVDKNIKNTFDKIGYSLIVVKEHGRIGNLSANIYQVRKK